MSASIENSFKFKLKTPFQKYPVWNGAIKQAVWLVEVSLSSSTSIEQETEQEEEDQIRWTLNFDHVTSP